MLCAVVFSLVAITRLSAGGFHPEDHLGKPHKMLWGICEAVFFGMLSSAAAEYLLRMYDLNRSYILISGTSSFVLLASWNLLVMNFYKALRKRGLNFQCLLLVGNRYTLPPIIRTIKSTPSLGQKIVAVVLSEGHPDGVAEFKGLKIYIGLDKVTKAIRADVVDNALFNIYRQQPQETEKAMLACQEQGINVWFKPDFMHKALVSRADRLGDVPLFVFSLAPRYSVSLMVKRLLDIFSAVFLLVLFALPMVALALLVKRTPGPAFFVQKRVGLNGRLFRMAKFRTMHKDAEQRRSEYNLKNEMQGPTFKMKDDPRLTPIGRFLRKYSLDELPQFWSVLVGDMSLVGPRPPIPSEVALYHGWQRRRLSMRPGITCIWQVTGRNKITDFNDWAALDLKYIDEWSLWLDFKILLKTIPAVFKGTGR